MKEISLPSEETNEKIHEKLLEKITDGTYNLGELIVPQKFEKTVIRNNKILIEEISIQGRKIPLKEIRERMFTDHKNSMRLQSDSF